MLDQRLVRRGFERAAATFAEHDFLHAEIRARLLDRLDAIRVEPARIVDLGSGAGGAGTALAERFPAADMVAIDLSPAMLRADRAGDSGRRTRLCADAAQLPLATESIDVIVSNLMLHHCPDPDAVLAEARRALRIPGVLLLTTFGPDTLQELGRAWATADHYSHIAPFTDMHNVGDALVRAGFTEPVIDSQTLTINYAQFERMIADLRLAGTCNATPERNRGLTGRHAGERLRAAYQALTNDNGQFPVTIEVIFAIAWTGESTHHGAPIDSMGGEISFALDRLARRT